MDTEATIARRKTTRQAGTGNAKREAADAADANGCAYCPPNFRRPFCSSCYIPIAEYMLCISFRVLERALPTPRIIRIAVVPVARRLRHLPGTSQQKKR